MSCKKITKADILFVRALGQRKTRRETGLFIVEGEKMVQELLGSPLHIHSLYALDAWYAGCPDLPASLHDKCYTLTTNDLERISSLKTPNQVLAVVHQPTHTLEMQHITDALSLALDRVQDPGNLGTILRLADWFGIDDIVCSEDSADVFNPKVIQASMGAVFRVRVHYRPLVPYLQAVTGQGLPVYGTFLDGRPIYDEVIRPHGVIVMGNESQGISPAVAGYVGQRLRIPCYPEGKPRSESLNVAVATALVCGEFRRRSR